MTFTLSTPFGREPLVEVPLPKAPLELVVAQVRFPEIASVSRPDFIGPFQEAIREVYPNATKEPEILAIAGEGAPERRMATGMTWRFSDPSAKWRVSLSSSFLALETRRYESRLDFLARLDVLLAALEENVRPLTYGRLGLRYVDRLDRSEDLEDLPRLVRPELVPFTSTTLGSAEARTVRTFTQVEFDVGAATLRARSAKLPSGHLIDHSTLEPSGRPSWVFDLDMFEAHEPPAPFAANRASERIAAFAASIYRVFRWAVSDEFLRRMGGSR